MANPEKIKFSVLREGTQFGDAASVEMTEREAEAFIRAGDIGPFDPGLKIFKSKTAARGRGAKSNAEDAAIIKQLQAELAAAKEGKGGADPKALADAIARAEKAEEELKHMVPMAQLKAAQDEKAAIASDLQTAQAGIAEFQGQTAALTLRVTEAEQLATDAASEAESLERVIALIQETQPELVAQAKETITAEYEAAEAAVAANPQG